MMLEGVFPFTRNRDEMTGRQSIWAEVHSPDILPDKTGVILVRLLSKESGEFDGWDLVKVDVCGEPDNEDRFDFSFEYSDGTSADSSEWSCWVDLSTHSFSHPVPKELQVGYND